MTEYDDGYADRYTDINGTLPDRSQHTFDVGYNPCLDYPANPIVCDKLLLFGSFKDVNTLSNGFAFDLCYDHILFDRPMLVIDDLDDVSSQAGTIKYSIRSGGAYLLLDEIYVEYQTGRRYLYGSGQYYNGNYNSFTGERLNSLTDGQGEHPSGSIRTDICVEFIKENQPFRSYQLGYNGLKDFACTKDEILSRFVYASGTSPHCLSEIDSYQYGGLFLPRRSLWVQTYTSTNGYKQYYPQKRGTSFMYDLFEVMIIPFINANEYHAAKASISGV